MKLKIKKRTLRSETVAHLLWGYGMIFAFTCLVANWFPEILFLKIILLMEELMLVFSLFREAKKIKKFNDALAHGNIKYGKIRPLLTRVESYERMRIWGIAYHVVCECEGELYDGNLVTYPYLETEGNFFKPSEVIEKNKSYFLEILENSEIPILIGEDIEYVALEEIAEQYGIETDRYFAIWLIGWIGHIVYIGVLIWLFVR